MVQPLKNGERIIRGEKTDMWALGITFYQLITGRLPYENAKNPFELREAILHDDIDFSKIKKPEARQVIRSLLQKDPNDRASIDELLKSSWVTQNSGDIDVTVAKHQPDYLSKRHASMTQGPTRKYRFGNF